MTLKASHISFSFADSLILDNISIEISDNSRAAIYGASGAGKTSLLRIIAGLEKPFTGSLSWKNNSFISEDIFLPAWKRPLAMVFQDLALWPHMTVKEHIQFSLKHMKNKTEIDGHIDKTLAQCHLQGFKSRFPSELSGGQQQRLALARAVASQPEILILDEPFNAIDNNLKSELWDMLLNLQSELGFTLLFVSHDTNDVLHYADSILLVEKTKVTNITKQDIKLREAS